MIPMGNILPEFLDRGASALSVVPCMLASSLYTWALSPSNNSHRPMSPRNLTRLDAVLRDPVQCTLCQAGSDATYQAAGLATLRRPRPHRLLGSVRAAR